MSLALLFAASLAARPTFRDYQRKGNENLRILERLFEKYTFAEGEEEAFIRIEDDWRSALSQYNLATGKERNVALKNVAAQYDRIEAAGRSACQTLEVYSSELLNDFSERVKNSKPEALPKDDYANQMKVAQGEFHRGGEYCRKGQYAQGAHLYDRGIMVLMKRYQVLQWPLPDKLFYRKTETTPPKSAEK